MRVETPVRYPATARCGCAPIGRLAPPETRGQGDHLGFPKIWVAREMRSRGQAEQAREG